MSTNQPAGQTGIAIVGLAGRFPKARNVDEFWRNLCQGTDGISFFSNEELAAAGVVVPPDDSRYVKARGVLADADRFDADFFGMNPREAEVTDPQHRVFLECAWEALENAGCDPETFPGAIGVFAGMSMNTYLAHNLLAHPELVARLNEHQLMLGNDKDFLPTRVSYKLNLRGPSLNIQTACSTSLVAVGVACQNLLSFECDVALAGAVSIGFPQKRGYFYQEGGIASPDGHCRAFDARAAGTVAGEGVGIVVLKRLADALADGDTIYAVIKGFAINNDGSNKIGYTAPSVEGQAEVIATAQAMAGFAPDSIGFIEAHGTGTPLGDPIEIEGLTRVFRAGTDKKKFCAIGSVKSNIGHLDVAAGVAGLIKAALALHHKKIPPSLHFESPNPQINLAHGPFFVNQRLMAWDSRATPRRAGVSSFGIGGTNAHVVLEEAPAVAAPTIARPAQLLLLSAKTGPALEQAAANLTAHLKANPQLDLADVACTLQIGRRAFSHRRMLVCRDLAGAVKTLELADPKRIVSGQPEADHPSVVFMFPGQGTQRPNMAADLYAHEPVFRQQVDDCRDVLRPLLGFDLREILFKEQENTEEIRQQLTQTAVAQPALFVVEYALAKLWLSWGIMPAAMVGHSIGEYVAACLAGVFDLKDALALVAARGRMMQELPPGAMLAVRLPEAKVLPFLNDRLSLAAVNSPALCVVSGRQEAVELLKQELAQRGVACTWLQTSHAFHSAMMEPVMQPFARLIKSIQRHPPQIPFLSNVSGTWITAQQATDPDYWAAHLRQTVRFADDLGALFAEPGRVLLEVGPGHTLTALAKQHPAADSKPVAISTLPYDRDEILDTESLLTALGRLWLAGVSINWRNFYHGQPRRRVPLPTYPFERKRFWVEPGQTAVSPAPTDLKIETAEPAGEPIKIVQGVIRTPDEATVGEDQVIQELKNLLGELSGLDDGHIHNKATFTEMGFDSLALTQVSLMLEKQWRVRISFRQLLEEFSTPDKLAARIRQALENGDGRTAPVLDAKFQVPGSDHSGQPFKSLPLTEAQRELWLASQMNDSASCAYNESRLLHWRGTMRPTALLPAMQKLVDRHEALRTTFEPDGTAQKIHPALTFDVPMEDWTTIDPTEQAAKLNAAQKSESQQPFDLAKGPLLRARLIRLGRDHHLLVLTVHHLICDGISLGVLLRELGELYSAGCRNVSSDSAGAKPEAPLSWSEYVCRQDQAGRAREADEDFWLKQFADDQPAVELPAERLPRAAQSLAAACETKVLPETLARQLRQVGAGLGGTLFTTLLAAYSVWLSRLSRQEDLVIGIPTASRAMPGGDSLVGHCVHFLPLRLRPDGNRSFADYLASVRSAFLTAHEHQNIAFGRLVQKLNLSRSGDEVPLATVTFNVQRLEAHPSFAGLELELDENAFGFTRFSLGVNITEINGALRVDCRYRSSLFSAATIRRWLGHFQTLLEGVAANASQKLNELPMLSAAERHQILVEWNPAVTKPFHHPSRQCLHQLFEEQAKRTPDRVAVAGGKQSVTYAQLNRRADELARQLRGLGVGPEVMVGLCLERSIEVVVAILAVLKAGGAYVPLDLAYPPERLKFVMADTQMPVLLTQTSLLEHVPVKNSGPKLLCLDNLPGSSEEKFKENSASFTDQSATNLAYVIYTSGSTGQPKGVMVTHQNVTRLFAATQPWYQFNEQDVWTLFHSCAFDFSVWEIWGALLYGGRLVIVPYLTSRSPEAFLELIECEQVTVLNQTPSAFRQLIQAEVQKNKPTKLALRHVIFGGEALDLQSLKPWFDRHGDQKPRLVNMYGITETTVHVTYRPLSAGDLPAGSVIGRPIPDLEIYILDAPGRPVPIGVPGEIYVGGAGVARGYWNRPELTAQRFVPHPFKSDPAARLYQSGDLARWLPDGDIEYLGRADEQVKIRGHRIELGEIESALNQHPQVRECVVVPHAESPGDQRLVAYIVGAASSVSSLREFLSAKLPDYAVPSAFVFLEKLPLTTNGKMDRRALPAPAPNRPELDELFVAPGTATEAALAQIWRELLQLERIGIHDDFFELGGHSLLVTRVISRVREMFMIELPMRRFFETPTIAGLASAIEELLVEEIDRLSEEQVRQLVRQPG